jgi:hypothetical protein
MIASETPRWRRPGEGGGGAGYNSHNHSRYEEMANMVNDHNDWAYIAGEDSLQDGNVETEEFNDCLKRDR